MSSLRPDIKPTCAMLALSFLISCTLSCLSFVSFSAFRIASTAFCPASKLTSAPPPNNANRAAAVEKKGGKKGSPHHKKHRVIPINAGLASGNGSKGKQERVRYLVVELEEALEAGIRARSVRTGAHGKRVRSEDRDYRVVSSSSIISLFLSACAQRQLVSDVGDMADHHDNDDDANNDAEKPTMTATTIMMVLIVVNRHHHHPC